MSIQAIIAGIAIILIELLLIDIIVKKIKNINKI
jgi:hypothetical protein